MSREPLYVPAGHEKGEVMSPIQNLMYSAVRGLIHLYLLAWHRLEVRGLENLPPSGAYIVSPIHRSNLDSLVISAITRRRMRYMGKESLWSTRPTGWFFSAMGGFPVQRGSADREALRAALTVVERGEPLVMFPEGTRQSGPVLTEFFDGPSYVSCRSGAPIIPVGLGGTEAAMTKGSKMIRPVKITIVVGEPLVPDAPTEGGRVPRRAIKEQSERLGAAIQELFDEAQMRAGRPNPPRQGTGGAAETPSDAP
ncbi:MAG: 1-acyl-sn-glycerol-3-phosphate acyltransferase [Acidobacteria bacterium]|nr:1-acyl-sn-glycerol-3-phosphate acyltransferase [Acidobacteriota bacterium]